MKANERHAVDLAPILIPIRTISALNAREHPMARHRRVRSERDAVAWLLRGVQRPPVPCSVRLTRLGPSPGLDDDNLASALKGVRDEIALWIGVDDRHQQQVRYVYAQRWQSAWGVQVEFGEPVAGAQFELLARRSA